MSEFPCKNPNCKSYGTPHPNCRCYGFAEGGEVKSFCETNNVHKKECQYFAEGGDTDREITTEIHPEIPQDELPDEFKTSIEDEEIPADEIPEDFESSAEEIPQDEIPDELLTSEQKYSTPAQQVGSVIEGAGRGLVGPLMPAAEIGLSKLGVPGLSAEDQAARQAENPVKSGLAEAGTLIGSMAIPGLGLAGAALKASKIAQAGEAASAATKIGSAALQGAIQTGIFQASDNVSKALLGQGDPNDSIGATLANGWVPALLTGGAAGAIGAGLSKGISALAETKFGTKLHSWLAGLGDASGGISKEASSIPKSGPQGEILLPSDLPQKDVVTPAYKKGMDWYHKNVGLIGTGFGLKAAYDLGTDAFEGRPGEGLKSAAKDALYGLLGTKAIKMLSGPASAIIMKVISNPDMDQRGLFKLIDHGNEANKGLQKLNKGIENLFQVGGQQLFDKYDFEKNRSKLHEYLENGGIDQDINQSLQDQNESLLPQGFSEGGEVKKSASHSHILHAHDPIAKYLPEQNIGLNTAKGRISNYLMGLKPQKNLHKLAFDDEPDQSQQTKKYHQALDIANQPLSVLDEIKKGTIEPFHVKHFNAMYPEINGLLQKNLTKKISEEQLKGEKPDYKIRQGLSLLMGTALSGELTPQNIQAAQMTFMQKQPQQQPQQAAPKNKKNTSTLTKADQAFLTSNQALVSRQQRRS